MKTRAALRFIYLLSFTIPLMMPINGMNNRQQKEKRTKMDFKIASTSFRNGDLIPAKYTCDGVNISPPLNWQAHPQGAKTFALINDDPDAPAGDWVHWIVYNIPAGTAELKEAASSKKLLPAESMEGKNDFGKSAYGGPCPPSGTHRYFFKLYALDTALSFQGNPNKKMLLDAMKGHILAQATLIGKYKRQ